MYLPLPREWSGRVALVMIGAGVLLLPDVVAPTPGMDLLLNVPLAMIIADYFGMTYLDAFVATYVMAFGLMVSGLMVYPYNTKRLLAGRIHAGISFIIRHPLMVLFALIGLLLVYLVGQWAYDNLYIYAKEVIGGVV